MYNRGVDKREIFKDNSDLERFILSIKSFNHKDPIGSIYENSFVKDCVPDPLLEIVAYSISRNHFHFIIKQLKGGGVQKFMQKFGTSYPKYFNTKYGRSGPLFSGKFKAIHIATNEYLLYLSVYVNLNNKIHQLGSSTSKLGNHFNMSSWEEYVAPGKVSGARKLCNPSAVLEQYKNRKDYERMALELLPTLIESKIDKKEVEQLFLE